MRRDKIMRVSKEFEKRLRNLANAKIKNGTAKLQRRETFSTRRLTLALTRHQDNITKYNTNYLNITILI